MKQNLRCSLHVFFVCGRLARGSLHYCSITSIAPESSSLRANYFIRAVTERERERERERESRMWTLCVLLHWERCKNWRENIQNWSRDRRRCVPSRCANHGYLQNIDDQIRQELPTFSHFLWYPWRKCKVGKNAILGLSRAEMVRNTCFQSNKVSVTYGLPHHGLNMPSPA